MPATPPSPRKSRDEAPLAEGLEDDVLERLRRVRAHVADVVAAAEMFELLGVAVPGFDVRGSQPWRDLDFTELAGLGIDEPHLAEGAGVAIVLGGDVDDEHV